jgi:hypothetical protein
MPVARPFFEWASRLARILYMLYRPLFSLFDHHGRIAPFVDWDTSGSLFCYVRD